MFINTGTGQTRIPTPSYFLGCFDIYDREETLGVGLERFNPDDAAGREELILKYCLVGSCTCRQRFLLYKRLEKALQDERYDFKSLLRYDPEAYSSFPCGWDEMGNTKTCFEDILLLAAVEWKDDLHKASVEDQATWITVN